MSALRISASLLEHCQCFLREDVFLISALGSVRGNTVPRDSIDTYTLGSRGGIGYYDPGRSFHSISPPVANGYQEIHRYSGMNIDNVKINTSLIMMKECVLIFLLTPIFVIVILLDFGRDKTWQ